MIEPAMADGGLEHETQRDDLVVQGAARRRLIGRILWPSTQRSLRWPSVMMPYSRVNWSAACWKVFSS
jgi:hypothetical protein